MFENTKEVINEYGKEGMDALIRSLACNIHLPAYK
jgi:hypothetical protein